VDGECTTDETGIAAVRAMADPRGGAFERRVDQARLVELGAARHPAIECTVCMAQAGFPPIGALVLFVPTGGCTTILSFHAWQSELEDALPVYSTAIASLIFARPPRGSANGLDRLLMPLLVSVLVGVLLVALSQRRRSVEPT
jgi:hypothetical protein